MSSTYCRVCGLDQWEMIWGEDDQTPNHGICPCCGVEFGYHDQFPETVLNYRQNWLSGGAVWFDRKQKPANWDFEEQLKDVPSNFR